ncbi:MAG: sulfatase-like hydrolase/transferase [Acidobacteria bacterium]|nr:sulfatase-like hydrolase/transferase [Acidobacteriota bacterium]
MGKRVVSALGGMGLATAFFMPIAAAGSIDAPLLMWTSLHTIELACAWAACAIVAAVGLGWFHRIPQPRRQSALILLVSVPSLLSLLAITGRNATALGEGTDTVRFVAIGGLAVGLIVATLLWIVKPKLLVRTLRTILPFGVILLVPGVQALRALPIPDQDVRSIAYTASSSGRASASDRCGNVYVLLFDELAYDAVFSGGRVTLSSLAGRIATAQVYHRASAPTASTNTSIGAYLSASPTRKEDRNSAPPVGLFGMAQAAGLETEVAGWYFPYCESLGVTATRCRSYSMYNAATAYDGFSLAAPFETVLNIWPFQMPTGLLKRPFAVRLHRAELESITALAAAPPPANPVLRWVHFNVPHVPWLQDTGPLSFRAFEQTRARYLHQLDEVDRALNSTFRTLETASAGRSTTVVITADHGSRRGHAGEPLHVPLIVWSPNGIHEDITEQVRVGDVLNKVVSGACRQ